jgi:hypothetical protein
LNRLLNGVLLGRLVDKKEKNIYVFSTGFIKTVKNPDLEKGG